MQYTKINITSESSIGLCISSCSIEWAPSVRCHLELMRFEGNLEMDLTEESDLQDLEKNVSPYLTNVYI